MGKALVCLNRSITAACLSKLDDPILTKSGVHSGGDSSEAALRAMDARVNGDPKQANVGTGCWAKWWMAISRRASNGTRPAEP